MKTLVFVCNWDGWSCINAASAADGCRRPDVNLIKLTCLSAFNAGMALRAFEHGADGALVLGCKNDQCQHGTYGDHVERELARARELLDLAGVDSNRLVFTRLDAFDARGYAEALAGLDKRVSGLAAMPGTGLPPAGGPGC